MKRCYTATAVAAAADLAIVRAHTNGCAHSIGPSRGLLARGHSATAIVTRAWHAF